MTHEQILRQALSCGAAAARLAGAIGSLEVGKRADLVLVGADDPDQFPVVDPMITLAERSVGRDVKTVLIDGRIVLRDGVLTTVDFGPMQEHVRAQYRRIMDRYDGDPLSGDYGALQSDSIVSNARRTRYVGRQRMIDALGTLDLNIADGEFIALLGPSDCGKTTVLNLLDKPTTGDLCIDGATPRELQARHHLGIAFQEHALLLWRSIEGNLLIIAQRQGQVQGWR